MIVIDKEQVYINLETKYSVDLNTHVFIEDVAQVYCNNDGIKKKVEKIRIYNGKDKEMYDYISGNEVTTKVLEAIDNIDITIIGGPDVLLEIKGKEEENKLLNFFKITLVILVLFFGAAAAIVNFYEDVNMSKSMEKIYFTITGVKKDNPLILTIPLSLGTGLGMFAFFSRIFSFSKRRRQEPGPMELELYLYDKDIEDNILNDLKKQKNSQ
ncbi:putative Stage V sporulation protein AA [[Clostridium] ultunense Esp]|uniref:Putative Stage V sporulation protein AA n=1 Tax=[Clostridium] ultunense Esp TaxID=1288971 RepID=M1YPT0_9FIRM|nr:stage V sporulation protein AA [Schnuerera ultunensis]CCQ92555.1 putative Stage V sporulation protein AA [[Clostridium] ultunense Esp]SHD77326.1 putative Stage V sporulation protein AA [[Clostridium] ultunense Esp]